MPYIIKQVKADEPNNFWHHIYWTGQKWITCRFNSIHESWKYSSPSEAEKVIANKIPFDGMEFQIESTDAPISANQILN